MKSTDSKRTFESEADRIYYMKVREKVVRALRACADAIELGDPMEDRWYMIGVDGLEEFGTQKEAQSWAEGHIEPDGGYHPDIGQTEWGIVVPVEVAKVKVDDSKEGREWARENGYDDRWDVSLVDAWPRKVSLADPAPRRLWS